jgi:hypothetical protein
MASEWRAVEIQIDFVDFLVARLFTGIVEEWFSSLQKSPSTKLDAKLRSLFRTYRDVVNQVGRIGMAVYLASYVLFRGNEPFTLTDAVEMVAIGLVAWAVISIAESRFTRMLTKRISKNLIPGIVLLTETDKQKFDEIQTGVNSPIVTAFQAIGFAFISISLNVVASYVYAYFTT